MVLRKNPATTKYRRIRRQAVRARLTRDDREGWNGVVVLFFRPFCAVALDRPGRLVGRSTALDCPRPPSPPAAAPARRVLNKPLNRFPAIARCRGKTRSNSLGASEFPNHGKREKCSAAYSRTKVQGHCTGTV